MRSSPSASASVIKREKPETDSAADSDDRSLMAKAMSWSAMITSIAVEMSVPPLVGLWIDQKLRTRVVFVLLGAVLGMTVGLVHLIRLTKQLTANGRDKDPPSGRG